MRARFVGFFVADAVLALAVCGCGMANGPSSKPPAVGSALPGAGQGRVMGGQQPVSGAGIQLYAVGTAGDGAAATPLLSSAVATDAGGNFNLTGLYSCPAPSILVYVTATGGNPGLSANNSGISLMTALGSCGSLTSSTFIWIDERTTVAAIDALAPFMSAPNAIGSTAVDAPGLSAAFTLASSLVNPATGQVPGPALQASANAPVETINTLANVLAACVNTNGAGGSTSTCGQLFGATTPSGGTPVVTTASAALNIMRDPSISPATLYGLTSSTAPFQPQLTAPPSDWTVALSGSGAPAPVLNGCSSADLTGSNAFTNYMLEQPEVCRKLLASDLPAPNTGASTTNYSTQVPRANGQMPIVPPGFKVTLYATGFGNPRYLLAAPNGDLLVSQPGAGSIVVLRGVSASGAAVSQFTYATGLDSPYGMAFYPSRQNPQYLYVANTGTIQRFPYVLGDTAASGAATTLATDLPTGGNHTTRSLAFTNEPTPRLLVGVGSASNVTDTDTDTGEFHRADILAYSVAGTFQSIFASGLRNPVGLLVDSSGKVWTSVNERDGLGDNVPADYVTHVQEGGFYGWPWYYNGPQPDPRLPNSHPELASQTLVADTLLQPHFAPLQIAIYSGTQFPTPYRGDIFVASHGSWNKAVRGGYELLRVHLVNGVATGEYEDFMTGFVNGDGTVWGRPAGVAVGADGALYVADDASNSVWRITYTGD